MQDHKHHHLQVDDDSDNPAPPPPPPHHRRPRVREVSSRFMSPSVSSSQRRQHHRSESEHSGDENSETPFPIGYSVSQRKQHRAMKLFKETNGVVVEQVSNPHHPSKSCSARIGTNTSSSTSNSTPCASSSYSSYARPDTPTPTISVSSRYRLTHHNNHHSHSRSINGTASAASKLLQASGMSMAKGNASVSSSLESNSRDDSSVISCSTQSLPELCTSENDRDMMQPAMSTVSSVTEKIANSVDLKFHRHPSPLSRSVSLPSSGGSEKQQQPASAASSISKQFGIGNQSSNHFKLGGGGLSLPPVVPQCAKPSVVDHTRKGKKGSSHQEDVHSLRLHYNRYLQWRFANARAASAMKAQQKESEKALYSHTMKISEMRDSVNRKRTELELLRRSKTLSTILEAQIPYLDEWSAMEEDYSDSITEAIQALLNASVQLPIGGNVRVDVKEVGETLNSALKMMETIVSNIQRFVPKAEETDISISELARVVGGERALIGECGDLLSKTYKSQVEECSLRGQLIQLHSICHKNKNKE